MPRYLKKRPRNVCEKRAPYATHAFLDLGHADFEISIKSTR
jgi:hypothetical protein